MPLEELVAEPRLYKNQWPWRVMPCDAAQKEGLFDKGFENKRKALEYQKAVKRRFPDEPLRARVHGTLLRFAGPQLRPAH